jgi:hypothetical protein
MVKRSQFEFYFALMCPPGKNVQFYFSNPNMHIYETAKQYPMTKNSVSTKNSVVKYNDGHVATIETLENLNSEIKIVKKKKKYQ